MIESKHKGKPERERKLAVSGDRIRIDKVVPADAKMTFIYPKDFKKAATLKDVLPSDPFLDDED